MAKEAKMFHTFQSMAASASMEQIALKLCIEKLQIEEELLEAQEKYFDRMSELYAEVDQLGFNPSIFD